VKVNPYLFFDGRCSEALAFYERHLGAELEPGMTFAQSPMAEHVPADWQDKIIHTQFRLGNTVVMASDSMPGRYEPPRGISLTINTGSVEEAERLFTALADGGRVQMALEPTFWATRFGVVTDRFGVPWMINCEAA
jgi:PhnB protein